MYCTTLRANHVPCAALLFLGGLVSCCGCSRAREYPQVSPVSGQVTFDGKPAAGAIVVFHHPDTYRAAAPRPQGVTQVDGSFKLTSFQAYDGAPPGTYAVTIVWPIHDGSTRDPIGVAGGAGPDFLRGRFSDPKAPFATITVKDGENRLDAFCLK
jgi:hypothetical protein